MKALRYLLALLLILHIAPRMSKGLVARQPAATQLSLSGHLRDAATGEGLAYGTVAIQGAGIGVNTGPDGYFELEAPAVDSVTVRFSFLGYQTEYRKLPARLGLTLDIGLRSSDSQMETVEIVGLRDGGDYENLRSTQTSAVTLAVDQLRNIPSLGGEVDVIKVVQLLPGVTRGGEGGTSLFVRGGDADQNLVLLDDAVVYNIGHLFGFFSVFNPDVLRDVTVTKGGFPPQHGGRLSSVLDVRMKEGDNEAFRMQGGIGLLSSRLMVEAPIVKNKSSFLVAARRTYIDQALSLTGSDLPFYFYDLNAKFDYQLTDRDRLYFSTYFGNDVLTFKDNRLSGEVAEDGNGDGLGLNLNFGFELGNFTQTGRWNRIHNTRLVSDLTLIHTTFNYSIKGRVDENALLVKSAIQDFGGRLDYTNYLDDRTTLRWGGELTVHRFQPNVLNTSGDISDVIESKEGPQLRTAEPVLYAGGETELTDRIKIQGGLRLSGAAVRNRTYFGAEPRLSANVGVSDNASVKLSYSRMRQYLHRVSSSSLALPTDLWYPVSENVRPQTAHQVAAGFERIFPKSGLTFSVEGYYKSMRDLIEYEEGSDLILNDDFEDQLLQGDGQSYGAEFLLRRKQGRFTGWAGYTLAWSRRQFDELNGGEAFWARYDRRHYLTLVGNYEISPRFSFSTVFEYTSGARFTPVTAQYFYPDPTLTELELVPIYAQRNALRLSGSYRWDVNFVYHGKPGKRFQSEWHVGAYNLTNRATPYAVRVEFDPDTGGLRYEQPGLFGFIPSVAWNFKFGGGR